MSRISRRQFMERTALTAAAAGFAVARGTGVRAEPLGIPIGCQTYPERQRILDGKFPELVKDLYDAGVKNIELCSPGYREFAPLADGKQTKKIITDAGLTCVSCHFQYTEFRDALPKAIQWAHDVGLTQIGIASIPANMGTQTSPIITMVNNTTTEDSIKRAAETYNKIAATAKKEGLQQFLHNEGFENSQTIDGRLTYPILLQALDPDLVKMQFQMSSMRTIGNPITYFRLYPGRFISAHVHGVDLEAPLPPPRGNPMPIKQTTPPAGRGAGRGLGAPAIAIGDDSVDWTAVFNAAKAAGLKNYFIEQEQNGGWDAMVKGAAYLKTLTV